MIVCACAVQISLSLALVGVQNVAGEVLVRRMLHSSDHPGVRGLRQLVALVVDVGRRIRRIIAFSSR